MKKSIPVVAFLCFISWVGAAAAQAQHEGVQVALAPEWKAAYSAADSNARILEFTPNGGDVNSWKELVTIQTFERSGKSSPEDVLKRLKELQEKGCPGVTQWNVIEKNENSILYEWQAGPCGSYPEQHEVARIIFGKYEWYCLHYAAKVHEIAPDTRAQWIKIFSDATFDPNSSSFDPTVGSQDVDQIVPLPVDKVVSALKSAMESFSCNVTEATADRIECKRPREFSRGDSYGGESVTANLEAMGDQTRVRISTGKGFYGRLGKSNWSTPIYQAMLKSFPGTQPSTPANPSPAPVASQVMSGTLQDNTPVNSANWGYNPAPGARLELKEVERKPGRHGTAITYHAESSGFPTGKTYSFWMMQSGEHKTRSLLTGYLANATGTLVCPGQSQPGDPSGASSHCFPLELAVLNFDNYHNGEPVDFAIVSTDGTVRAYARAYPFPIHAQDGKCTLNVEIENSKFTSFVIRGTGFEPNENVKTLSSFGNDATPGTQQASPTGEFAVAIHPDSSGNNSGSATFTATGNSCHPIVTYEWGKAAMKVQ